MSKASANGFLHAPRMPDPSMLSSAVSEVCSFPADRGFWDNFISQVKTYPGAMDPPQYQVDASHTNECVLVNQEFLRRFLSGWERANPHLLTLSGPTGTIHVHTSEVFWNRFVTFADQRSSERAANGELRLEDVTVESSLLPMNPLKTTTFDWNEFCLTWEQEEGTGPRPPQPVSRQHDDGLVQQLLAKVDSQQKQITSQNLQLEEQRRQIEKLRSKLDEFTHQSSHNNNNKARRSPFEAASHQQGNKADQLV
eukprot:TRINITY_DN22764_c0_g1_i1.p1 TRINITY_DN22764_c0_g1~~TRINITY_DN22764_c0_g1_i1.p1  ORF type:complete len:253 (+),score=47.04 TRINITY_DN22764_c0_g1_i1:25-783(+)